MKTVKLSSLAALIFLTALIVTSCGDSLSSGIDMTDAGNAGKIKETVVELTEDHSEVIEITLDQPVSASDDFSSKFGRMSIYALEGGDRVNYITNDLKADLEEFSRTSLPAYDADKKVMDLSSIDYTDIAKNIEAAKEQIPEGYSFKGLGLYSMYNESDFVQHDFILEITEDGNSTEISGNSINTIYYEMEFETDKDGNVTYVE